jgi:hypothetical protein
MTTLAEPSTWGVGDLARHSGVTVRTLHHYEAIGLLRACERTAAGHRRYHGNCLVPGSVSMVGPGVHGVPHTAVVEALTLRMPFKSHDPRAPNATLSHEPPGGQLLYSDG